HQLDELPVDERLECAVHCCRVQEKQQGGAGECTYSHAQRAHHQIHELLMAGDQLQVVHSHGDGEDGAYSPECSRGSIRLAFRQREASKQNSKTLLSPSFIPKTAKPLILLVSTPICSHKGSPWIAKFVDHYRIS